MHYDEADLERDRTTLQQLREADLLIIDERLGRQIAEERGIAIIGTLGVLDDAADQGLINLAEVLREFQRLSAAAQLGR